MEITTAKSKKEMLNNIIVSSNKKKNKIFNFRKGLLFHTGLVNNNIIDLEE